MKLAVSAVAMFAAGCFNPTYNNPTCGPEGECPSGLVCVAGTCRTSGDAAVIDQMTDDAMDDAMGDAMDGAMVDMMIDAEVIDVVHVTDDTTGSMDLTITGTVQLDTTILFGAPAGFTLVAETQANGTSIAVLRVGALNIPNGTTLRATGTRALAILAGGNVSIAGTIDVSGTGRTPGAGGFPASMGPGKGGDVVDNQSGGTAGLIDPGAGGAGHGTAGAIGGLGRYSGFVATESPGPAGVAYGGATSDLVGGSGGGSITGISGCAQGILGGAGGGALLVFSRSLITLSGVIIAGGGGAQMSESSSSCSNRGGSGGGAGGRIELQAPMLAITGMMFANGGGGGGGAENTGLPTTPGQDGRASQTAATGGPASNLGGDGGRGGVTSNPPMVGLENANGGGGGGAVGRIHLFHRGAQPGAGTTSPPPTFHTF